MIKIERKRTVENWNKRTDCFQCPEVVYIYVWDCRFTFGWLEAIWFCVAHGHTSSLPIFAIITSRCSQLLLWRFSAASSGSFSVLKMSGTRWIPNHTCSSLWVNSQMRKRNYFIPMITVYRVENSMMHISNILSPFHWLPLAYIKMPFFIHKKEQYIQLLQCFSVIFCSIP